MVRKYPWEAECDAAVYIRLLNTYSGHIALDDDARNRLFQGITDLIETEFGGSIVKQYPTVLYVARASDRGLTVLQGSGGFSRPCGNDLLGVPAWRPQRVRKPCSLSGPGTRASLFLRGGLGEIHLETTARLDPSLAALAHGYARQIGDHGFHHAARLGVVRRYAG